MKGLNWILGVIFAASLCFVVYCSYQIFQSKMEVKQGLEAWDDKQAGINPKIEQSLKASPSFIRSEHDDLLGKIVFPDIAQEFPIVKGVSEKSLEKGVGYDPTTPFPGGSEGGNSVLAGHRDGVFRKLGELQNGDEILMETEQGTIIYEMMDHTIVDKNDPYAIKPSKEPLLTLVTCYPFSFIGDAPKRYIIRARMKE